MPAVKTDLVVEQGTTWAHGWRVTYDGDLVDDTWTVAAQIRDTADKDGELLYEFTASVSDAGDVVIGVPHADSSAWDFLGGYYDVEITNAGGTVRLRVAGGAVSVSREVTDD